ncbi:hypothetical protein ACHAXA_005005 [Cyclostephanos tholiformis]|uniref:FAD-binding domain-containing protein n=1 Tax=Cyclostephanos tholiformis TaxID=382380 RepID=A0ABD3RYS3_9STRA
MAARRLLLLPSSSRPWHSYGTTMIITTVATNTNKTTTRMRGRASSSSSVALVGGGHRHHHHHHHHHHNNRRHHRKQRRHHPRRVPVVPTHRSSSSSSAVVPPSPSPCGLDDGDVENDGVDGGGGSRIAIHDAIIVGGGPTGLLLSNMLSNYGIRSHLLLESRSMGASLAHPRAHYINVRSMEILRMEVPRTYAGVTGGTNDVTEWEGFNFGGSVSGVGGGGGIRLGRVVHPVRRPPMHGRGGNAVSIGRKVSRDLGASSAKTSSSSSSSSSSSTGACDGRFYAKTDRDHDERDDLYVSACRPAHLAQNKLASMLLYDARGRNFDRSNGDFDDRIRYGEGVIGMTEERTLPSSSSSSSMPTSIIAVRTSSGRTYRARYLLAADGAHSFVREACGIRMIGNDNVQDLINVHFRTNIELSRFLMRDCDDRRRRRRGRGSGNDHEDEGGEDDDRAMLHFVYNDRLVGVFVCHDGNDGEWVLQIPYFPPYQTIEDDFGPDRVREMIWSGLLGGVVAGGQVDDDDDHYDHKDFDFDVLSIRPWKMSCLVAERYVSGSHGNVILVGDAAHAFPPAGGLGMNTGLQDAHNVAWRIALEIGRVSPPSLSSSSSTLPIDATSSVHEDDGRRASIDVADEDMNVVRGPMPPPLPPPASSLAARCTTILAKYDEERRPIAARNAALSMRNYERTLRIAEACYLDANHPRLLMSLLNSPPANILPIKIRRDMFRSLVRAAMSPLGCLLASADGDRPSSHAIRIKTNVRRILESGGSLPLVFPRYELGFSYGPTDDEVDRNFDHDEDESNDAAGYVPRLKSQLHPPTAAITAWALR